MSNIFEMQRTVRTVVMMKDKKTGIINASVFSSPLPIIPFIKNIRPIRTAAKTNAVQANFRKAFFLSVLLPIGNERNPPPRQTTTARINKSLCDLQRLCPMPSLLMYIPIHSKTIFISLNSGKNAYKKDMYSSDTEAVCQPNF